MMNHEYSSTALLSRPPKDSEEFNSQATYQTFTYQTRFFANEESAHILQDYATLYGHIERSLFTDRKTHDLNFLKQSYLARFGITARQFNAIRISVDGKIESAKQALLANILQLKEKIITLGNQSCVATVDANDRITLRLRLPDALSKKCGKYVVFSNIFFEYGHKEIVQALALKQALSYRFKKDEKGWRVLASFKQESAPITTRESKGAIGVDINANYIALVEIDHNGNLVYQEIIPLNTYGKTQDQAKALIGDACKKIVLIAKEKGKPIVAEQLDFTKKKASLKESTPKYARMLSSFSYSGILQGIAAKAFREGVAVFFVNPAMTSIIGKMKFAMRYGMSGHLAAALCIARRHYRFSEAPSKSPMKMCYKNIRVTCPSPVRKRGQHVWTFWRKAERKLKTVLAELHRAYRSPCPQ